MSPVDSRFREWRFTVSRKVIAASYVVRWHPEMEDQVCETIGCLALEERVRTESLDVLNVGDHGVDINLHSATVSDTSSSENLYIKTGSSRSALEDCGAPWSIAGNDKPSTKILCTPTRISNFSLGLFT